MGTQGRSSTRRRRGWRIALLVLLVLLAWPVADFAYLSTGAEVDYARPADAIIVLGCHPYADNGPSDCISARTTHAADLYKRGLAPRIIPTGGSPTGGPLEAAVMRRLLEEKGVPSAAIVEEDRAQDTIQNIYFSRAIMQQHGWHTAILVTEPFHINRAALIARDARLEVYPSPAVDSPNWKPLAPRLYNLTRDSMSLMLYQVKWLAGVRQ